MLHTKRAELMRPNFGKGYQAPELVRSPSLLRLSTMGRNYDKALGIAKQNYDRIKGKEAGLKAKGPLSAAQKKDLQAEYMANRGYQVEYGAKLAKEKKALAVNQKQMEDVRDWHATREKSVAEQKAWEKQHDKLTHAQRKLGLKPKIEHEQGWHLPPKKKDDSSAESW